MSPVSAIERAPAAEPRLDAGLVDLVLDRLGLGGRPALDVEGLRALYAAWCRRVPFDNLRKRIHVAAGAPGALPGDTPEDFFRAWLAHGCGGTCWAGNGALYALLVALGFDAARGIATMVVAPGLPPNHATVTVLLADTRYLVDASILHQEPLPLRPGGAVDHPAWGVPARLADERWHVRWRAPWRAEPLDCRVESWGASAAEFSERHAATRAWSPFNFAVCFRVNRGDRVLGVAYGQRFSYALDGRLESESVDEQGRRRFLVEVGGIDPELMAEVPPDEPTPPPPGSATARSHSG
jgi:arylamine N-acetyltransferase